MDFSNLLTLIEKYSVDYVRYILSVTSAAAFRRRAGDIDPKLFTFSVMSAVFGEYIYDTFVSRTLLNNADMLAGVVTEMSVWIGLSVIVYVGLSLGRRGETRYTGALTAVLRVLPVAFVLSGYAGFIVVNAARLWADAGCAPWWSYASTVVARLVILVIYLPVSLTLINTASAHRTAISRRRVWAVSVTVATVMVLVQAASFGAHLVSNADDAARTYAKVLKLPVSDPARRAATAAAGPLTRTCLAQSSCVDLALTHAIVVDELSSVRGCFSE